MKTEGKTGKGMAEAAAVEERLVYAHEVARRLGVSLSTVRRMTEDRAFPPGAVLRPRTAKHRWSSAPTRSSRAVLSSIGWES